MIRKCFPEFAYISQNRKAEEDRRQAMENTITRRKFLNHSGRLFAGVGAASLLQAGAAGEARGAAFPIGCRDTHLKETGEKDCWSALDAIGAEGVEASLRDDLSLPLLFPGKYSIASREGLERLAADLKAARKRIFAFCMYNRFEERPDFEIRISARVARAARALGVPAIRIDVVPRKLKRPEFLKLSVETLKKLMDATESTGVNFAIENHSNTTNDPEFLHPLFEQVGSKRLGLTLDTANFYWFGHPLSKVYEIYQAFASRAFHTHCKSIRYPGPEREKRRPMGWEYGRYNCPLYEGDIDFRRVVRILKKAGYANDLCIENESLRKFPASERSSVLAREVRFLKNLL
jgi:sugar phosphate isomerase/epimerase